MIYVFTESHQVFQEVLQDTSAGATVQNDTMIQNSCERAIVTCIIVYILMYASLESCSSKSSEHPSVWWCGRQWFWSVSWKILL